MKKRLQKEEGSKGVETSSVQKRGAKPAVEPVKVWKHINLGYADGDYTESFKCYKEEDLEFLRATNKKKELILDFNMKNLEPEFDYATDEEQMGKARRKLYRENINAVEFYWNEESL